MDRSEPRSLMVGTALLFVKPTERPNSDLRYPGIASAGRSKCPIYRANPLFPQAVSVLGFLTGSDLHVSMPRILAELANPTNGVGL